MALYVPVYPRWRGEHGRALRRSQQRRGLSPLARGTLGNGSHQAEPRRFIPAGAGNTDEMNNAVFPVTVYPRWRGEHRGGCEHGFVCAGLSPLARGTPPPPAAQIDGRFIPAGAGNTGTCIHHAPTGPVYPRWRGEHLSRRCRTYRATGLSPLARGTLH